MSSTVDRRHHVERERKRFCFARINRYLVGSEVKILLERLCITSMDGDV